METVLGLLAVFTLVFVNGFFVAAEFALVGARRTRIVQLAEEGHKGAQAAYTAITHLDNYIAATQLGITLTSLGLGWIGEPAVGHLIEALFADVLPEDVAHTLGTGVAVAVAFSLVTMLHIVLGELAPKAIALQRPEGTALIVSRPIHLFSQLFRPVIFAMNSVGNSVVRMLGFEPAGGHERVHSAEELLMLVHSAHEAGVIQESEEKLLQRVFDFGDVKLGDVMQPRVEVEGIAIDTPLPEVVAQVTAGTYSRYPVYQGSLDRVVGVLHAKDLFDVVVHQPELLNGEGEFDLASILRTPLFFPEMASVDRVLEHMQRTKMHFAVVIDEYGGMAGIATMEDILEELVGEVQDEFDQEPVFAGDNVKSPILDGLTSMNDVIERFGEPGRVTHSSTLGGFVTECLDRIPTVGDKVAYGDYDVVVLAMDEMRVAQVQFVRRGNAPDGAGDQELSDQS